MLNISSIADAWILWKFAKQMWWRTHQLCLSAFVYKIINHLRWAQSIPVLSFGISLNAVWKEVTSKITLWMLVLKKELYLDQLKGIEDYSNVWKNEKIPNFEKRHFRTTKRPKRQGTPTQICSMSFSDKINFYDFLKDKYVSETFIPTKWFLFKLFI